MASDDSELSALRSNIREKGEFSYYYAHKNNSQDLGDAKIFQGPGIVTGGQPVLLHKDEDPKEPTEKKPQSLKINKYSWSDCGESIQIYINLQDLPSESLQNSPNPKEEITEKPILDVTRNSISLQVPYKDGCFFLKIPNLSNPIDSELCRVKVSSKRITAICFKEDSEIRWNSLSKPML
ncbi:CS domain protein [Cryptosporidium felis]|nr:CS domain protein [Cryptosporidium felis]